MIAIDDILISEEIIEKEFVCNLNMCKGECCVAGDIGAPLDKSELSILKKIFPKVKSYLTAEGIAAIKEQGTWVAVDDEDEFATPMIGNGGACAYTIYENEIAKCGIEKAFYDGKIEWKKPISCHLYPIRITKNEYYTTLNYNKWNICAEACKLGKKLSVPVYEFLKEPIIRRFGAEFYDKLNQTAQHIKSKKTTE